MTHPLLSENRRFDLDAYLARIGFDGSRAATLDTLRELHLRHPQAIAFENVDPLLRRPVSLDTATLMQKLVHDGRGGYCFEHNLLFAHALEAMNVRVGGLAARVLYGAPVDTVTPRSHMLLRIDLDDAIWIADVGFGGLTLTAPLLLTPGAEQETPHGAYRLMPSDAAFVMEALVRNTWTPLYRFTLEPAYLIDYEVASFYLCHSPRSHFIAGLVAARARADCRLALRNNIFTVYYRDGYTERRMLHQAAELRRTLGDELGIRLPDAPELDAAFERIAGMPDPAAITTA